MNSYVSAQVPEPIRSNESSRPNGRFNQDYTPLFYSSSETGLETGSEFDSGTSHKSSYNFGFDIGLCGRTERTGSLGFHHTVNLDDDDDDGWSVPGDDHVNLLPDEPPKEIPILLRISNFFSSFLNITRCK